MPSQNREGTLPSETDHSGEYPEATGKPDREPRIYRHAIVGERPNCRVVIAQTPDQLRAICEEITPVLIINNSHFELEIFVAEILPIKNIIGQAGIKEKGWPQPFRKE